MSVAPLQFLLLVFAGWVNRRQLEIVEYLQEESFLDPGSVASAFWSKGKIEEREQLVPANAWLRTSASVEIIEHATASNEFRTVLSMLWVPEPVAGPLGMAA